VRERECGGAVEVCASATEWGNGIFLLPPLPWRGERKLQSRRARAETRSGSSSPNLLISSRQFILSRYYPSSFFLPYDASLIHWKKKKNPAFMNFWYESEHPLFD
jgi:hypothetical protein